jgi:DNA topoisomerase IA
MTLFFAFSVSPVAFGEPGMPEGKASEQTLIAKAKKKSSKKKKKKKKKRIQTAHCPIAPGQLAGNTPA